MSSRHANQLYAGAGYFSSIDIKDFSGFRVGYCKIGVRTIGIESAQAVIYRKIVIAC